MQTVNADPSICWHSLLLDGAIASLHTLKYGGALINHTNALHVHTIDFCVKPVCAVGVLTQSGLAQRAAKKAAGRVRLAAIPSDASFYVLCAIFL